MNINDIYAFIRWEGNSKYDDMNLISLKKTEKKQWNWAIYYNGMHTGLFLPHDQVSQEVADYINKKNNK